MNVTNMYKSFGLNDQLIDYSQSVDQEVKTSFKKIDKIREFNQLKVLKAFQEARLSDTDFNWNTGYGYDDVGRDKVETIYSNIFNTEDAIVRPIIVSGTHALALCLRGILRPGDEMLSISGKPYDTLEDVIGIHGKTGDSLADYDILYNQVDLNNDGAFNTSKILDSIKSNTKMMYIQRSSGYEWRKAITIDAIKTIITKAKSIKKDLIVMVDNCYGEFLDFLEPTDVGADVMAGSLIKNPGGGLALSGGYIVGKEELVRKISYKLTSPGIGKECGLMFGQTRSILQGLFMAPNVVSGAIKGAIYCAKIFEKLGYEVSPSSDEYRSDIIQSIKFNNKDQLIAFCQGIQAASPVDSFVKPMPWDMPGYQEEVIMAAGAFVQGSSIELSADAPIKEPYIAYFQGGLTYDHSKFGVLSAINSMIDHNQIEI